MARPSNRDERRAQIITGMLHAIADRGYAGATISHIARAANLSPGLIHYHFDAKAEILAALIEDLSASLRTRYLQALDQTPTRTARACLHALLFAHVGIHPDTLEADARARDAWIAISAEALRDPDVQTLYRAHVAATSAHLQTLLSLALEDPEATVPRMFLPSSPEQPLPALTHDDPRATRIAAVLHAAILGAFAMDAAAPGVFPEQGAMDALIHTLDALLRSPT